MKICLINNLFAPYERGGAEVVVDKIVQGLTTAGHEVFVITTDPAVKNISTSDLNKTYRLKGIVCSSFYKLNQLPIFLRLFWHILNLFNLSSYLKIRKILTKEKPDLVLTHNLMGIGFLTPLAIKSVGISHYHTLHDIQLIHPSGLMNYGQEEKINSYFAKFYQSINRKLFKSCDKIISPSDWLLQEHLEKSFFKNCTKIILPNPIIFNSTSIKIDRPNHRQAFKFIFVGQLENHKGINYLIETFKKLTGSVELTIIGDGSLQNSIKEQLTAIKNINLLGRLDNSKVLEKIGQSDCLIMPSLCYENSPTVIYEALSLGTPVLAASIGGIPELLNEDDRLLFKPNDETELLQKLNWATTNQDELLNITKQLNQSLKQANITDYLKQLLAKVD